MRGLNQKLLHHRVRVSNAVTDEDDIEKATAALEPETFKTVDEGIEFIKTLPGLSIWISTWQALVSLCENKNYLQ